MPLTLKSPVIEPPALGKALLAVVNAEFAVTKAPLAKLAAEFAWPNAPLANEAAEFAWPKAAFACMKAATTVVLEPAALAAA